MTICITVCFTVFLFFFKEEYGRYSFRPSGVGKKVISGSDLDSPELTNEHTAQPSARKDSHDATTSAQWDLLKASVARDEPRDSSDLIFPPGKPDTYDNANPSTALRRPRRAEDTNTFELSRGRGCKLDGYTRRGTIPATLFTQFTSRSQIERCGYEEAKLSENEVDATQNVLENIRDALESLKISTDIHDQWKLSRWTHSREKTCHVGNLPGQKKYPASWAHFENYYNPTQRVILAFDNLGPAHVKNPPAAEDLVPLRSLSDFWFLDWENWCNKNKPQTMVRGVRYILRYAVQSEETKSVIATAIGGDIMTLGKWKDARTFTTDSNEGLALLGSPNGRAIGW